MASREKVCERKHQHTHAHTHTHTLLLGPLNRGTRPQPAETAELPGLAAEHWWIAEVCTVPGGLVPAVNAASMSRMSSFNFQKDV